MQHTYRLPCPSATPGACSNSCPLSQWCHPTISSSVFLFCSCLQSFLALGSFLMSRLFTSGGPFQGFSLEKVMCYWDHRDWTPDWTPLRPLYRLLRFLQVVSEIYLSCWLSLTSLICKFLTLLKLPPTNLKWSTSFCILSLPSVYKSQFQIPPTKFPRLQTNIIWPSNK